MMQKKVLFGMTLLFLCLVTGCGKGKSWYNKGVAEYQKGNTGQAVEYLARAAEKNPDKAEYFLELGLVQLSLGQIDSARASFEAAFTSKDLPLTRKNNKNALRGIGVTYYQEADYERAEEYFRQALSLPVQTGVEDDLLRYYADTLYRLERYADAADICSELIAARPQEAPLYRLRAKLYLLAGDVPNAIADYELLLNKDAADYEACFGLYEALLVSGDTARAANVLRAVCALEQPTGVEEFYIAKAKYLLGEENAAMDGLLRAAANGFGRAYFYIGEMYRKRGSYRDALTYYELAAGQEQGTALQYYQMAACYEKIGEYEQELACISKALERPEPEHLASLLTLEITALEKIGDYQQAYERTLLYLLRYPDDAAAAKEAEFIKRKLAGSPGGEN